MPDQLKCPKCKEGIMRLPLALAPLQPNKPGSALTCSKCGYQTTSLSAPIRNSEYSEHGPPAVLFPQQR
jgi:hypothetical protein